ncbi:MAG TPA: glycosyltransferase family 39 protein, partial [Methanocella sp.]|nr:glycosyltransferase family 39 protein [Methanocella sp.]
MLKLKMTTREGIYLALILAITGFLSFYAVWREGYGNAYYAAAVKSMLTGFHDFFFVSFDPGGFVSVDKPPLGLWIQAFSAMIFGFQGWSLILPQAVATVVSTVLIFHLVRRSFGKRAGLVSALVFALTPIVAAVSRTNNLDPLLVMVLLFAAWALIVAAEKGSIRLLLLSMVLVGVGFNIKMVQAYGVLPAFLVAYLLSPVLSRRQKIVHLSLAALVLLVVSLSWATIVDLTPADQRPYVGSSHTNSVLELALGYNGVQRIMPSSIMSIGMPIGAGQRASDPTGDAIQDGTRPAYPVTDDPGGIAGESGMPAPQGGMGGPGSEAGEAGVFRLFDQQMAGQISWLLPLAILGFFSTWLILRNRDDGRAKLRSLCFWGLWMLPMLVYFSISGFFHRYYLIM